MAKVTRTRAADGETIEVNGVPAPVVVRRVRRARRFRIRVDARNGEAVLVLPSRAPLGAGRAFAQTNAAWLRARLDELPPRVAFAPGAEIQLEGETCLLLDAPGRGVQFDQGLICVGAQGGRFAQRLTDWLKRRARARIAARAHELAQRLGRPLGRIGIRDPKARWGSCSAKGDLSFSWRLILAPPQVLDYVVAHEVAHLAHPHHGPRFWRAVERLMPDYAAARAWLNRHGSELQRFG